MKKVLLFGAHGQVGTELRRALAKGEHAGKFALTALDRSAVDLTRQPDLRQAIRAAAPDIVINAAAYTAVDKAESERELAFAVNADAPRTMAEECQSSGALLVHYSTDYVFDGGKRTPYIEFDPVCPINVYGESKLAGERAITSLAGRHWILRIAWVYSVQGKNFLLTILRLARAGQPLRIVDDQIGVPTPASLVADITCDGLLLPQEPNGIFHCAPQGETSWFGFAQEILQQMKMNGVAIEAIPTSSYPTPAQRPAYSVLSSDRLRAVLERDLPSWQTVLRDTIEANRSSVSGAL